MPPCSSSGHKLAVAIRNVCWKGKRSDASPFCNSSSRIMAVARPTMQAMPREVRLAARCFFPPCSRHQGRRHRTASPVERECIFCSIRLCCIVLCCVVLYCIVLHCMYCIALYVLYCIVCIVLHRIVLHRIVCIVLHRFASHLTTPHHTSPHLTAPHRTSPHLTASLSPGPGTVFLLRMPYPDSLWFGHQQWGQGNACCSCWIRREIPT